MDKTTEKIIEEAKKQFEEAGQFGIKFAPLDKTPFVFNMNRTVEIIHGGQNTISGFYRGLTQNMEDLVLFPVIVSQYHPKSVIEKEREGIGILCWEDRPALINYKVCTTVLPISESYLVKRVNQIEELNSKIILP